MVAALGARVTHSNEQLERQVTAFPARGSRRASKGVILTHGERAPFAAFMNFQLLVPELFWPAAAGTEPYRGLSVPALETLLARGARSRAGGVSLEHWLGAAHGLPADLPLAPYSLRGDGMEPGDGWWLRADPVHLKVHGDRLVLADASRLDLEPDEAGQYVETLNRHFAADGIIFFAPVPQRWYAKVAGEPQLGTPPTAEVAGRSVAPFLPAGDAGARWRSTLNEIQMLLHEHPCSGAREASGRLPVNSVWLWGAGRARRISTAYGALWGDHPLVTGLAFSSGAIARPLPDARTLLDARERGPQLVVLPLPTTAYGDLGQWRGALAELEQEWFQPLLEALRSGTLESLALHGLGADFSWSSTVRPRDLWRFWRPRRPLHAYA